ncbi:MAG: ATP-binding protein [Acidobacteriaceae bacterium]|jgi:energy-coupling factor transporter ATP-binding protein EcfA2
MPEPTARKYIVNIVIEDLFGQYSYNLVPKADSDALSQLFLLYGENGTGKTTILWLLNHLLSKENGEGHRSFLAHTQFSTFAVHLNDGTILSATRPKPAVGNFQMTLIINNKKLKYNYIVNDQGDIGTEVGNDKTHEAFRHELPDLRLTVLADDRKISSVSMMDRKRSFSTPEYELSSYIERRENKKDPSVLQPALDGLQSWATSRQIEGSNLGQRDVNAIYVDLLKRLSRTDDHQEPLSKLLERLSAQGKRSSLFSRFGLSSEVDVSAIITTITDSPQLRQQVMAQVIRPYMDSNEVRFAALDSLQKTLATFVDELNVRFLMNKRISFNLAGGVRVESSGQVLDPRVLSSGEKQLLVLFCNVAQASDRESIFIIDEPELSLNVEWQRFLIDALQKLGSGNIQFIFATHSLELLARHRKNVAKLVNRRASVPISLPVQKGSQE